MRKIKKELKTTNIASIFLPPTNWLEFRLWLCKGPFTSAIYCAIAIAITIRFKCRLCIHFAILIAIPIHSVEKNPFFQTVNWEKETKKSF